jgi:RNA polymerase sigma-70 factor (ECF subfamily)
MVDSRLEFQQIYADFQPKILRYLARLVGDGEAEDLTQEVFVKIGQALQSFRGECKLSTWIYRIATNAAVDKLRRPVGFEIPQEGCSKASAATDEAEIFEMDVLAEDKAPAIEQQLVRAEMDSCIADFINRLPEKYRVVILLSELEGLRNAEIAEILGVTLETVKIRLHRGRTKLRQELISHCDSYWVEENEFVPDLNKVLGEF